MPLFHWRHRHLRTGNETVNSGPNPLMSSSLSLLARASDCDNRGLSVSIHWYQPGAEWPEAGASRAVELDARQDGFPAFGETYRAESPREALQVLRRRAFGEHLKSFRQDSALLHMQGEGACREIPTSRLPGVS
jgi:hypothetical protein